jgi:hypothetical protein
LLVPLPTTMRWWSKSSHPKERGKHESSYINRPLEAGAMGIGSLTAAPAFYADGRTAAM